MRFRHSGHAIILSINLYCLKRWLKFAPFYIHFAPGFWWAVVYIYDLAKVGLKCPFGFILNGCCVVLFIVLQAWISPNFRERCLRLESADSVHIREFRRELGKMFIIIVQAIRVAGFAYFVAEVWRLRARITASVEAMDVPFWSNQKIVNAIGFGSDWKRFKRCCKICCKRLQKMPSEKDEFGIF